MPSLNLNNNKVEEIPNVRNEPSDLIKQLQLMMDKKISIAQLAAGDMHASMSDEKDALKKGKNMVDNS